MASFKIRDIIENLSPVLIGQNSASISIGLSKRFFIFQLLKKLTQKIEDDPYLNFISVLKNYKILGSFLNGTLYELHRDRNNSYMRNFFIDKGLYAMVKADIEWLYSRGAKYREIMLTITKRGVIIYDNYKKNSFNVLLTTIHSGQTVDSNGKKAA